MTARQGRILVVDDDAVTLKLLRKVLTLEGYDVVVAASGAEALEKFGSGLFHAAVVDVRMPGMSGLDVLGELKQRDPSLDVVMTTAHPEVDTAVEALKRGAYDYLQKPLNLDELRHRMSRVLERRRLRGEVSALRGRLGEHLAVKELIGVSPEMLQVKELVTRVAAADAPVLIQGESGTGKELVAAAMHRLSGRSREAFIPVNCAAIPAALLESEFFGHVRGAFTGAVADTLGLFRSAEKGTIFLDEIGDLPPALQAKLLRVLQEREVRPVGSTNTHPVDVRVISATNRQLHEAVKDGTFREDLFYRLNVVPIEIPPLRKRKDDIPPLVTHFLHQLNARLGRTVSGISAAALDQLLAYDFPGNVRELENILERAYALGAHGEIVVADLPRLGDGQSAAPPSDRLPTVAEAERDLIVRAIRLHPNRHEAARAIGLSTRTMFRRLREYGIG